MGGGGGGGGEERKMKAVLRHKAHELSKGNDFKLVHVNTLKTKPVFTYHSFANKFLKLPTDRFSHLPSPPPPTPA